MSKKRTYAQFASQDADTQLVAYSQEIMSSTARPAYRKRSSKLVRYAKKGKMYRAPKMASYNKTIIATTVDYDVDFTADVSHGFGFSPSALWVNDVTSTTYIDATSIQGLFDLARVHKVEMTILPGNNTLGYDANSLSTGARNIPYGYCATDLNSGGNPSLNGIRDRSDCQTFSLDKMYKRTFFPRLRASDQVTDCGRNNRNLFVPVASDIPWYGVLLYLDLKTVALTYDVCRISFKVYLELSSSR